MADRGRKIGDCQEWYVTKEELAHSKKRWQAQGFKITFVGDDMHVEVPDIVTIVYKLKPEPEEYEQLSFL